MRINVTRSSMPPLEEYVHELEDIWENRWLTNMGVKHQEMAEHLKKMFGVQEISLFTNGHLALEAIFSTFPPGSEVITTPFTYASTTLAILRAGLVPKFCDIEPEHYTLDPALIEEAITEKTVAIAPVHVYGNLCRWKEIARIAGKHGLKVIYDAAHAFGVKAGEFSVAALGDVSMFSFHATKVFHTIEGGCLASNDKELSKRLTAWSRFGMYDGETVELLGTNAKMTEFQAAMGLCNLRHLQEQILERREAALHYRRLLSDKSGIVICPEQPDVKSNYAYFPIRIIPERFGLSRDELQNRLASYGVFARKYFYPLTSQFPVCAQLKIPPMPIAEQTAEEVLCLPMYADLTPTDVDYICEIIVGRL